MLISELFEGAINDKHFGLALLLDFVVNEKKTVKMTDHKSALDVYLSPKNRGRMAKMLDEYLEQKRTDENWIVRKAAKL